MAEFDIKGLDRLTKKVDRLETQFIKGVKSGVEQTLYQAQNYAQYCYVRAEYDGVNDATVNKPEWVNDREIQLKATGSSLLFIEFGAGIRFMEPINPYAIKFGYERGSYGRGLATKRHGLWIFKMRAGTALMGRDGSHVRDRDGSRRPDVAWTGGNPATNGMYYALTIIQNNVLENIIKAVR